MNLKDLKKPFSINDIEWRVQQSGMTNNRPWAMVLAYVTNRAIQNRLDEVCGMENWYNEYEPGPSGGVKCGITIRVGENDWITKWDGADNTSIEAIKGGFSDSMKRAAVQWGIGRYLYDLHEGWAKFVTDGCYKCKIGTTWYEWNPPALLPEFLPAGERTGKKQEQKKQTTSSTQQQTTPRTDAPPIESSKLDPQKAIKLEIHNRLVEMYGENYAEKGTLERITEWVKGDKTMPGIKSLGEKISDRRLSVIRGKVSIEYKKFEKSKGGADNELPI